MKSILLELRFWLKCGSFSAAAQADLTPEPANASSCSGWCRRNDCGRAAAEKVSRNHGAQRMRSITGQTSNI